MPEENIAESAEVAIEMVEDEARAEGGGLPKWVQWASLSTMVMALFSASGGLLAGKTANEAIIDRQVEIHELIELTRIALQTETILTRLVVLESSGQQPKPELLEQIQTNNQAVSSHAKEVGAEREASESALRSHEFFAIATTLLSVAITLTGMAVIVRRLRVWIVSLVIAAGGAALFVVGVIRIMNG